MNIRRPSMVKRDLYAGALMAALGIGAVLEGRRHSIGTLTQMGTGYFPILIGLVLAGIGVAIALSAFLPAPASAADEQGDAAARMPDWRGCGAIVLGVSAFIGFGRYFGLAPATFACVFISALGDRDSTLGGTLVLSAALTAVAAVVFWYLLQVQMPVLCLCR